MGSMILLSVGRLEIAWGKNHFFPDFSTLFQASDLQDVPYYYAGDAIPEKDDEWEVITEYKEGLLKPLSEVIDRIKLLGYTSEYCKDEFNYLCEMNGLDTEKFTFEHLKTALETVDVYSISLDYGQGGEDFGKFFRRELFPRLGLEKIVEDSKYAEFEAGYAMENLSPYTILTLLANNPTAKNLPVIWGFKDLEENGWAKKSDFVSLPPPSKRFLIVTEGSSDTKIIKQAFKLLKPHLADFFEYVDMEDGYPFAGTGNMINFLKGLIKISVQNNVVVLFDNDVAGVETYNRCHELPLLENIRVLKLPDMDNFQQFNTIGPNGSQKSNVNGQGAAIECYLDLPKDAAVRWNNYNSRMKAYQGELIKKTDYMRKFLSQRKKSSAYDYSKIEAILDMIITQCSEIQQENVRKELGSTEFDSQHST